MIWWHVLQGLSTRSCKPLEKDSNKQIIEDIYDKMYQAVTDNKQEKDNRYENLPTYKGSNIKDK